MASQFIAHSPLGDCVQRQFLDFYGDATNADNKDKLFVMIVDECHYGATDRQAHDTYVNDCNCDLDDGTCHHGPWADKKADKGRPKLLDQRNFLTLLVSATPYCVLSRNSRIPERLYVPHHVTNEQLQQPQYQLKRQDVLEKHDDHWQLSTTLAQPDLTRHVRLTHNDAKKLVKDQVMPTHHSLSNYSNSSDPAS